MKSRLQALLFRWCHEASLPTEHGDPVLPTVSDSKRALAPPSKSNNTRFPTEGRKAITCYSIGGTKNPVPPRYAEGQQFTLLLPARESCLSCARTGIPVLKAAKEKRQVTYKGKPIRITDFSTQTLNTRRSWKDIIQALKECNCQLRLVYPTKLSFLIEGETKTFHNKEKLKEFSTTKTALQKILKGLLHIEEETRVRQVDSRKSKTFPASIPVNKE
jgi:hypothetical protein